MIAILLGLFLFTQERIHSGYLSYAPLERVVEAKKWQGTDAFDILLATPNCNDVSRWVWVITSKGVESGLVVDCSEEWNPDLGLVADCNRVDLVHEFAFVVMR